MAHVNLQYWLNGKLKETIYNLPKPVAISKKNLLKRTTHKRGKFIITNT